MWCPLKSVKFGPYKFKSYSLFGKTLQENSYHTETSQLIWKANQLIGFSIIRVFTEWYFPYFCMFSEGLLREHLPVADSVLTIFCSYV